MAGGKVTTVATSWLNFYFRGQSFTAPTHLWLGLFTTTPIADGTGGVEVSGGAYARQDLGLSGTTIWAAPSNSKITNSNAITFPQATANWGLVKSAGLWDASSAGNLVWVLPMVSGSFVDFEAIDTVAGDITSYSHGFTAGQQVRFFGAGATLPTGISRDTVYYVISAGLTTDKFRVATTPGGSAVVPSATGGGEVVADASFNIPTNATLSFAAGQIAVTDTLTYT